MALRRLGGHRPASTHGRRTLYGQGDVRERRRRCLRRQRGSGRIVRPFGFVTSDPLTQS
jgi:hypothetical protein